jgi:hypothetical protein
MKFYIGLDIGLTGGVVVLDENSKIRYRIAMDEGLIKPDATPDVKKIFAIINHFSKIGDVHVILERFAGFHGISKKGVASLERQGGKLYGMVELMDFPYTASLPKNWQKIICGDTKQYDKTSMVRTDRKDENGKWIKKKVVKKDTKRIALVTVNRLFPKEKWLRNSSCRTSHDGMVDACLLALYGIRKRL